MSASPPRPLYYSTSKDTHTLMNAHTHRENVGHSERIYSRIQNTGKNVFPFNLLSLPLAQYGRMNSGKVAKAGSLLNYT